MKKMKAVVGALVAAAALAAGAFAADTTPPTVTDITADGTPLPDAILTSEPPSIVVTFSEDIDAATVSVDTFRLVRSGGDGTFGDGNEITITPAPVILSPGNVATIDLTGATMADDDYQVTVGPAGGTALRFDGDDDHVVIGAANVPPPWTAEFWVKRTVLSSGDNLMESSGNCALRLEQWPNTGKVGFTKAGVADYVFDYEAPVGVWVHLAFVSTTTDTSLYVNGTLTDTNPNTIDLPMGTIDDDLGSLHAVLDEVRLWDLARTGTEIRASMKLPLSGGEPGLVGYYNFDEGAGQIAGDSSPSGNDSTLGNNAGADSADPVWVVSTAPITGGIKDLSGNPLDGEFSGSFPSGDTIPGGDFVCTFRIDTTPPTVLGTSPADGAPDASIRDPITVTFSETMDDSVPASVFTISPSVAGTLSWAVGMLVFTPDDDLPGDTFYTVTISTDAADLVGHNLASPYQFTFTTHEDVPPTVLSTDPADSANDVLIDASVGVTVSEPMDQTATEAAFSISPPVAGSFSWAGDTLTFDPASDLPHETDYTVTVDTGATDVFGNPLAAPYSFTFRVPDVIAPYVLSTSPTDAATDVPLSASVTVTFSEDMDPAATAAAFSIEPAVSGTPSVSGAVLTLDPSGGLESDTEYTVTITTGATDLVGLGLAADYTFTFTTEDLTAPADVTGLALTASSEEIAISWRNPFDLDFAGVVILRSVDGAPTGAPADGTSYIVGNIIENAVVIYVGVGSSGIPGNLSGLTEPGLENGREYYYAVFAHDGEMNYSAGVSGSATPDVPGDDGGCAAGGRSPLTPMLLLALLVLAFGRPYRAARERA